MSNEGRNKVSFGLLHTSYRKMPPLRLQDAGKSPSPERKDRSHKREMHAVSTPRKGEPLELSKEFPTTEPDAAS